ncbi:MAG TPA: PTS galactitol transporter subunit IIA [Pasteurellaceae bacterium]|nr:PTS galactitol transporter subunit IIA [Pasteurellaceae bacterium]
MKTDILIKTDIKFNDYGEVFRHLADRLIAEGFVKESYLEAIFKREKDFPTGIALEHHAIAIPHSDALHALKPVIYFIRPNKPVQFNRSDEDGVVDAELIIALVVTDPQDQLVILRKLFGKLQDNEFIEQLLIANEESLPFLIEQNLSFS